MKPRHFFFGAGSNLRRFCEHTFVYRALMHMSNCPVYLALLESLCILFFLFFSKTDHFNRLYNWVQSRMCTYIVAAGGKWVVRGCREEQWED